MSRNNPRCKECGRVKTRFTWRNPKTQTIEHFCRRCQPVTFNNVTYAPIDIERAERRIVRIMRTAAHLEKGAQKLVLR